jgi:Fe-S-cluster containining protein
MSKKPVSKKWWSEGIRFECQGSGQCCTSHGEFGFVYLTLEDRRRFAKHFKLSTREFTRTYCEKTDDLWHLKERKDQPDCQFLEGKRCGVYAARPEQCRTWPFWPEVMSAKRWKKDVADFCPGVGKGRVWSVSEIEETLRQQKNWDAR